ncbi:glycosyltransferase [Pseudoalteromonas tunicata]|jgi:hypothetical protein|uniref:Glycosyl transferase family 1 domain-containing protein n=1 Tax=Pseudoalteromonas tunicata D2 TaxID=87626 RepID=A4C8J7_9GAMM|nr:glycosyltransferase [Pseudoalteromonas tunicata]ATC93416.1 hypothetical protein PTUN_a0653 [Pseudoalteromonas tunicata]AXT32458.1 hypothetical protein D1819_17575 [Pseudoalteromonas tunicata]EAR28912.1 hypothetical protein PTD2_07709 [Pseudoalteromonas tunicata D2]
MKKVLCISFPASTNNGVGYFDYYNKNQNAEFYYFRKSIKTFFLDYITIFRKAMKCQVVIINYVSLFLLFGPLLRCFLKKVIFIPHEGEPLFPKQFKDAIPFPRSIISSIFLSRFCVFLASETYCLSMLQAEFLKANKDKVIRFGINPHFVNTQKYSKYGCFFPNRKRELIKAYDQIHECHHLIMNQSFDELSSEQMSEFYEKSKIVLIPSIIETYSYCLAEAMLANSIVLATKQVGLAYDLCEIYSIERLAEHGIYIFDTQTSLSQFLLNNYDFLNERESNSRNIALEVGLSGEAAQSILNSLICDKND